MKMFSFLLGFPNSVSNMFRRKPVHSNGEFTLLDNNDVDVIFCPEPIGVQAHICLCFGFFFYRPRRSMVKNARYVLHSFIKSLLCSTTKFRLNL